jgi:hypothetical protein
MDQKTTSFCLINWKKDFLSNLYSPVLHISSKSVLIHSQVTETGTVEISFTSTIWKDMAIVKRVQKIMVINYFVKCVERC